MDWKDWLVFLLYLPFGAVLSIVRIILGFTLAIVTPSSIRPSVLRILGGFICTASEKFSLPEKHVILSSNHTSYLDYIFFNAALDKKRACGTVIWHGVSPLIQVFCRPVLPIYHSGKNRKFLRDTRKMLSERDVIFFPEGSITNGHRGLLTFERACFGLGAPVYMIALKFTRPLPFVRPKALSNNPALEMAIELFQPWIHVEVTPVGIFSRQRGQDLQEITENAQAATAEVLGLWPTKFDRIDRSDALMGKISDPSSKEHLSQ